MAIIRLRSELRINTQQDDAPRFGIPNLGVVSRLSFQYELNKEFSK
jgi:hypothetical protein